MSTSSRPIEGQLSRQLDIRFIDARELVNEAKLALGITGYASKDQEPLLMQHALSMFDSLPTPEQDKLHQMNGTLLTIKSIHSQSSSVTTRTMMRVGSEDTTDQSSITSQCTRKSGSRKGWFKRTFSIDP